MNRLALRLPVDAGTDRDELRISGDPETLALVRALAASLVTGPGAVPMARLLAERLASLDDERSRELTIIDALLPPLATISDAGLTQLRWNAVARQEALREFGAPTAAEIAAQRGARTTNPHVTTSRWVSAGRVFAVETPGGRRFPGFQLRDGEPRPEIAHVLAALRGALHGWELLLWFTGSNGYLDGARPVDLLDRNPDAVVGAAREQAAQSED